MCRHPCNSWIHGTLQEWPYMAISFRTRIVGVPSCRTGTLNSLHAVFHPFATPVLRSLPPQNRKGDPIWYPLGYLSCTQKTQQLQIPPRHFTFFAKTLKGGFLWKFEQISATSLKFHHRNNIKKRLWLDPLSYFFFKKTRGYATNVSWWPHRVLVEHLPYRIIISKNCIIVVCLLLIIDILIIYIYVNLGCDMYVYIHTHTYTYT